MKLNEPLPKIKLSNFEKTSFLRLLHEYFDYSEFMDSPFSLESMENFILSKTFSNFCFHEIITFNDQIKLIYSYVLIKINNLHSLNLNFLIWLVEILYFWIRLIKKKIFEISNFDKEYLFFLSFTINQNICKILVNESEILKFKEKSFFEPCAELQQFFDLDEIKEKQLFLNYLIIKIDKKICKLLGKSSFKKKNDKIMKNFIVLQEQKTMLYCIYDKNYDIILKIIYDEIKSHEYSNFFIFNQTLNRSKTVC